jgi:hypothetical protein
LDRGHQEGQQNTNDRADGEQFSEGEPTSQQLLSHGQSPLTLVPSDDVASAVGFVT